MSSPEDMAERSLLFLLVFLSPVAITKSRPDRSLDRSRSKSYPAKVRMLVRSQILL